MAFKRCVWVTANSITYQGASVLVHGLCGLPCGGITIELMDRRQLCLGFLFRR